MKERTIGSIVAKNWRTASVFHQHNIDFCCKGNIPLTEACAAARLDADQITDEINAILEADAAPELDYAAWPLDRLAEYIETRHHGYVTAQMPELSAYLDKLCVVHGGRHPELLEIRELFAQSVGELTTHMKKEELMLFPFVKKMAKAQRENQEVATPIYGTVQNPIAMMMHEHIDEGDRFAKIAELSDRYTVPADGCTTYRVAYNLLQEFEEDLHKHIHLENNILFPGAIALEKELTASQVV
ncbi:iron-sulfur cluster repair di-iron protein [Cytophagaceae bacterium SJW1-29]|uniref:Iron-sulfur cluster repair di-iron protein n=1 Tax=Salmonirosea aquatica TaxID=2654236 RepID=A0A7C9FAW0_9BACT|nr:iron-sulfur cluster repair di-iron protein [Cytophagaceae bacterium SJW1-29]